MLWAPERQQLLSLSCLHARPPPPPRWARRRCTPGSPAYNLSYVVIAGPVLEPCASCMVQLYLLDTALYLVPCGLVSIDAHQLAREVRERDRERRAVPPAPLWALHKQRQHSSCRPGSCRIHGVDALCRSYEHALGYDRVPTLHRKLYALYLLVVGERVAGAYLLRDGKSQRAAPWPVCSFL